MKTKRFGWLMAILAALALLAAACGDSGSSDDAGSGGDEATTTTAAATDNGGGGSTDEVFRVAIVAPSAANDLAFTQSIVDGVDALKDAYNIEVDITDGTFIVEDAAAAVRGYAEGGYDLVIAHGSQYGSFLADLAKEFPEVSFAWGTAADTFGLDNVFAYSAASDEGAYVMGTMAAALSQSKVVGVIGPIEVGDAKLYVDGFVAGVAAQDPAVETNVNYIESFSDVALAAEAAQTMISGGADVLTGTAQMVVGATGVAQEKGVAWFGTQSNQTSLGPDIVVASQVYKWDVVLSQMIDQIKAGTLGGQSYEINLANKGLVIEYNDNYPLPDDVRKIGDDTAAAIADGSMSTGVGG